MSQHDTSRAASLPDDTFLTNDEKATPSPTPPHRRRNLVLCFLAILVVVVVGLGAGLGIGLKKGGGSGGKAGLSAAPPTNSSTGSTLTPTAPLASVQFQDPSVFILRGNSMLLEPPKTRTYDFVLEERLGAPNGIAKMMLVVNGEFCNRLSSEAED